MQLQFSKLKVIPLLAGMTLAPAGFANAGTLSFIDEFDFKTTNFEETLTINKFDTNLGTLNSIEFEFTGAVKGDVKFESLDAAESTVTATLSSVLELNLPDDDTLFAELNPFVSVSDELSAYDGTIDFGGTSGRSYTRDEGNGVQGSTTKTIKIDAPTESDLALFAARGGGSLDFSVNAEGRSVGTGSGNLITQFATLASAGIRVSYDYEENEPRKIPEPTGALGIGIAGGLALLRKRKKEGVET